MHNIKITTKKIFMIDNSKFTDYITIIALYAFNTEYTTCYHKHLKLRNQARLCLAISRLKLCLDYRSKWSTVL